MVRRRRRRRGLGPWRARHEGQVAAEVVGAVALAAGGWRPARGELLVVVTADEEMGAAYGAKWLCKERPELLDPTSWSTRAAVPRWRATGAVNLHRRARREGRFPAHAVDLEAARATGRCRGSATTRCCSRRCSAARCTQPDYEPTPEGIAFLSAMLGEPVATDHDSLAAAVQRLCGRGPSRGGVHSRADPRRHADADDGRGAAEGERDPLPRRAVRRLPGAARARRGLRAQARRGGARRRRLRDGVRTAHRRQPIRTWHRALGRFRVLARGGGPRRRPSCPW